MFIIIILSILLFLFSIYLLFDRSKIKITPSDKKAVLITGCDSGLGYFCAQECHANGFIVIVTVLSKASEGSLELIKKLQNERFIMLEMNLTDEDSILATSDYIKNIINERHIELYAIVNNAAVMTIGEFEWLTLDSIKEQIHVNLLGPMLFTNKLLPVVRQHKSRIINVASHCSIKSLPGFSVYSATKAAIKNWSEALGKELKKFEVQVVIFIPGSFVMSSNIAFRTSKLVDEIINKFSEEQIATYKKYMTNYYGYVSHIWSYKSPGQVIFDRKIINAFMNALLDVNPKRCYKVEPIRYKFYFNLFKINPFPNLDDWLTEKFVSLPKYD